MKEIFLVFLFTATSSEFLKPAPLQAKARPQVGLEIEETPKAIPGPPLPKKFNVDKTVEETLPLPDSASEQSVDETLLGCITSILPPLTVRQSTIKSQSPSVTSQQHQPGAIEDMLVALRTEMNEKFSAMNEKIYELHQDMLFTGEERKMSIIMQIVRSNIPQNNMLEDVLGNLDLLNQTDHFVTSFYKMSEENKRLKEEIAALKLEK